MGAWATDWNIEVSIRAPVRGRTPSSTTPTPSSWCFNPRPREGANIANDDCTQCEDMFQSAPP